MNVPFLQTATFTGLVSTDEYYTSQEWKEAYDDSQVLYTNVASNSANWDIAYNIATFYAQNSAILIEETTFSELTSLKANNQLKPGQFYVITDFQLKWGNPSFSNPVILTSPVIEPLLVQALSSSVINPQALSLLHPTDIVYYDIDAKTSTGWGVFPGPPLSVPGIKGWITRRIDTLRNIDIPWDWRYITVNCCRLDVSGIPTYDSSTTYNKFDVVLSPGTGNIPEGKLLYSVQDNNQGNSMDSTQWWLQPTGHGGFVEKYTYFPVSDYDTTQILGGFKNNLINIPLMLNSHAQFYTFTNSFTVTGSNASTSGGLRNIYIESGSNNVFGSGVAGFRVEGLCYYNILGFSIRNIKAGNNFNENTISGLFYDNVFGDNFSRNVFANYIQTTPPTGNVYNIFGNNCTNNIINAEFRFNTIDDNFSNNRIGRQVQSNIFGKNFTNNKIVNSFCISNTFGSSVTNNNLNTSFSYNKINDTFQNNTIGTDFTYNTLGNNCTNNTIGDFCSYNNIANNFSSNTIETFFLNNNIANEFSQNIIGDNCTYNNISNSFLNNTTEQNFTKNNINNEIQNINFTGATHVYNNYDKNIFKNFDSVVRLSYFNSNDQLVVTDPTA